MDTENTTNVGFGRLKKRKERNVDKDVHIDNHCEVKEISQENIVQKKCTKRKKKKSTMSETSDLPKRVKISSNETIDNKDNKDTSKEEDNKKTSEKPSKRRLKKEKAIQMVIQRKQANRVNTMQKALSYVSKWKHARNEWKFEKLKQIWLMDNLLDDNLISDAIFPIVIEYFEGCKGMAREVLLKKGMEVIRKAEEEENENNRIEIIESIAYKRARQLLQALPSDR